MLIYKFHQMEAKYLVNLYHPVGNTPHPAAIFGTKNVKICTFDQKVESELTQRDVCAGVDMAAFQFSSLHCSCPPHLFSSLSQLCYAPPLARMCCYTNSLHRHTHTQKRSTI